jgi:hypothetical protein
MKLSGVMPPIATPFQDGKLASDKLKNNFQIWNKTGLSGYLVLGFKREGKNKGRRDFTGIHPYLEDHACWNRDGID